MSWFFLIECQGEMHSELPVTLTAFYHVMGIYAVGVAAFDLRLASLHLSQYIETSSLYQNTKTLLHFYDPMVIIVHPNKLAPDGMVGVSELVDRCYTSTKKVIMARGCFDDTKGAVLVKSLATKEPSALALDTYYKQYYLCLAAATAAAAIKCPCTCCGANKTRGSRQLEIC